MKIGSYKHVNNTDVAIIVKKVTKREGGLSVVCHWVNIVNPDHHFVIDYFDLIFIKQEDLSRWETFHVAV